MKSRDKKSQPSKETKKFEPELQPELQHDWKMDVSMFQKNGCLINFN